MVSVAAFGTTSSGEEVKLISIKAENGAIARFITLGAAIQSVALPQKRGDMTEICLGYDTATEYQEQDGCLGAIVGRCANRIADASFKIGGETYILPANDGKNHLHGGGIGFQKRLWDYKIGDDAVSFSYTSPHMEEGYPAAVRIIITYAFDGKTLATTMEGIADGNTVLNLTNHAYWNLSGHDYGSLEGHTLQMAAEDYTETDAGLIPTGALLKTANTPLDFSAVAPIYDRLNSPMLKETGGYDCNYALSGQGMRQVAVLKSEVTGITMRLETTLPGIQIYTANFLSDREGLKGTRYKPQGAICLEPQFFPNAINLPEFESPLLCAGERYYHKINFKFEV